MSSSPLVSIIIPTYNHAHFLHDALESVCDQTFSDWEAVVVNNYSEDGTIAVVESFRDSRIRLENFHNNGVIAAARNRGIELARGQYLAFLDSDDIWFPEKLATCIHRLENGCDLVCHGLRWFGNRRERDTYNGPSRRASFDALLYKGNCIATSATVVRKSLVESVGGFSESEKVVTAEDYHLWLKLAYVGARMGFVDKVFGGYRTHSNNSGTVARQAEAVRNTVDEFFSKVQPLTLKDRVRRRFRYGTIYYARGRGMQVNGQFKAAWPWLLRALLFHPLYARLYLALALNVVRISVD